VTELKDQIAQAIQDADRPVLTVDQLAEEVDETPETVEENVSKLRDEGRVDSVQVDGTTAYYIRIRDYPKHKKPDHYCGKCGREVYENGDSGRVEFQRSFSSRQEAGGHETEEILCRFCFHDFVCWLHNDEHLMHVYPHVEDWDIPEHQLEAVRQNSEFETEYPGDAD